MHLLAAQPGAITDGEEAVDLGQTPGEMVYISAADTELALLADASRQLIVDGQSLPTRRLANLMQLGHNMSVDLYVDEVIQHAKIVVIRILGGYGYWPYRVDRHQVALPTGYHVCGRLPQSAQPHKANIHSHPGCG